MNYRKIGLYTTLISSLTFQAYSQQCTYKSNDNFSYVGHIESTKIESKKVFPYVDDTRKCRITLQSRIDGEWHLANAEYIFGPDMSEDNACRQAETRAKRKIMNWIATKNPLPTIAFLADDKSFVPSTRWTII